MESLPSYEILNFLGWLAARRNPIKDIDHTDQVSQLLEEYLSSKQVFYARGYRPQAGSISDRQHDERPPLEAPDSEGRPSFFLPGRLA